MKIRLNKGCSEWAPGTVVSGSLFPGGHSRDPESGEVHDILAVDMPIGGRQLFDADLPDITVLESSPKSEPKPPSEPQEGHFPSEPKPPSEPEEEEDHFPFRRIDM